MVERIKLSEIYWDDKYYPRKGTNWMNILQIQDAISMGSELPPIAVVEYPHGKEARYLGLDGKHRWTGAKNLRLEDIKATILKLPKDKWLVYAIEANRHGLKLSPYEIADCVLRLKAGGHSYKQISEIVKIPMDKLQRFMLGKTIKMKGKLVAVKKPLRDYEAPAGMDDSDLADAQRMLSGANAVQLAEQLIHLLNYDLVDHTSVEIADMMLTLRNALDGFLKRVPRTA